MSLYLHSPSLDWFVGSSWSMPLFSWIGLSLRSVPSTFCFQMIFSFVRVISLVCYMKMIGLCIGLWWSPLMNSNRLCICFRFVDCSNITAYDVPALHHAHKFSSFSFKQLKNMDELLCQLFSLSHQMERSECCGNPCSQLFDSVHLFHQSRFLFH